MIGLSAQEALSQELPRVKEEILGGLIEPPSVKGEEIGQLVEAGHELKQNSNSKGISIGTSWQGWSKHVVTCSIRTTGTWDGL